MPLIAPPNQIRTARLLLRKPRTTDAALMFTESAQDPAVTRYLMWRPHDNIAETRAVIDRFLIEWERQEGFCWFLFTNDTGGLIGSIAARPEINGFNLGFLLARPHWGYGYMPEAIVAVVEWAFTQPQVSRVSAVCDMENHASGKGRLRSRTDSSQIFSSSKHLVSSSRLFRIFDYSPPLINDHRYRLSGRSRKIRQLIS